jgi:hypothetical protein
MPENKKTYVDPFVGGGAVYIAVSAERYIVNDKSDELIGLYNQLAGKGKKVFVEEAGKIMEGWGRAGKGTPEEYKRMEKYYRRFTAGGAYDAVYQGIRENLGREIAEEIKKTELMKRIRCGLQII